MKVVHNCLRGFLLIYILFVVAACSDDKNVEAPDFIKSFVATHFDKASIVRTEKDRDGEYEVYLSDGSELTFSSNGEWLDIQSYNLPDSIVLLLPNGAGQKFLDSTLIVREIERKAGNNFVVETMPDNIDRFVDANGNISPALPQVTK